MRETVWATALGAIALKTRTTISDRKIFCILGSKGVRRAASLHRVGYSGQCYTMTMGLSCNCAAETRRCDACRRRLQPRARRKAPICVENCYFLPDAGRAPNARRWGESNVTICAKMRGFAAITCAPYKY